MKPAARSLRVFPDSVDRITGEELQAHRTSIRHVHDVPVLVTAIKSRPDWVVTSNVAHFTPEVAARTGLRIVTPHEFLARCRLQP